MIQPLIVYWFFFVTQRHVCAQIVREENKDWIFMKRVWWFLYNTAFFVEILSMRMTINGGLWSLKLCWLFLLGVGVERWGQLLFSWLSQKKKKVAFRVRNVFEIYYYYYYQRFQKLSWYSNQFTLILKLFYLLI